MTADQQPFDDLGRPGPSDTLGQWRVAFGRGDDAEVDRLVRQARTDRVDLTPPPLLGRPRRRSEILDAGVGEAGA
jgi:hypothetical protein